VNGATAQSLSDFRNAVYNSTGIFVSTASSHSTSAIGMNLLFFVSEETLFHLTPF
jgi:hypothetical protein